ncbi:MAG TPA: EAL domain-containing protein [Macromonas sp.]|nr:EAL domain-containing protein [Macromonas sp.]
MSRQRQAQFWVSSMLLLSLLLWTGMLNLDLPAAVYLPLHTTLEFSSIVVAMLGFGIAWHARAQDRPGNIVLLGVALMGTGLLDFGHTLSYQGMPDLVSPASPQKAIAFWLAARYLMAIGLLAVALRPWLPLQQPHTRHTLVLAILSYVVLVFGIVLWQPQWVPNFFVAPTGLTPLKVGLEYALVAMYGAAALLFLRQAQRPLSSSVSDLYAAAAIAALSELFFTRYGRVTDLINATGHLYKIVSYAFIYRAVFVDSVHSPFRALQQALNREQELAAEQHTFVRTLDLLEEAVLELEPQGRITRANNGWWRLIGLPPSPQPSMLAYLHQEDREAFLHHLQDLHTCRKEEFRGRFRLQHDSRPTQWIECRFVAERDANGQTSGMRGVLRDITKTYLQERHISHMALHDALTGLPNRVLLEDRLKQAVQHALRESKHVGVCFIDLDHFKNINDAYGHKTGDAFLLSLTQVLKGCLREGDTLARWGGDEFVVLLPDLPDVDGARQVAKKMIDSMRTTIVLDELSLNATFSVGIALFPEDEPSGDVDLLLAQADRAMFYAKAQGRNNFQLFSDMSSKGLGKKDLYIQSRLAQAIREEKIAPWYQPLVSAQPDGQGHHRMVGIEVLARWHDPDLGWISPGSFIPMAENLGLISDLGQSVRRQAFSHFQAWRRQHPELTLSINISKRQLFASDFIDLLMDDLLRYDLEPDALVLEVTESVALMDVEFAEERLRQLESAGFTLSLDDFGTGYASLSQLHELPIDELKIDISFVRRVHTSEGLRLVQGIVSLAKALRLRTVAEGVEDAATARVLADMGVDVLQGYHFGRPCTASDLEQLALVSLFTPLKHLV